MENKVCIVTGCDRGIGREIALGLAKKHYHIVMACVDVLSAEKTRNEFIQLSNNIQIEVLYVDLGVIQSVNDFCDEIKKKFQRIDILINNAAIMLNGCNMTPDNFEAMFQINYLSQFHLTHKLLPLLSRSLDGRILNIGTKNYKYGKSIFQNTIKKYDVSLDTNQLKATFNDYLKRNYQTHKTYAFSKYLFIYFSAELAKRIKKWGYNYLNVMCVDTGVARTQLADNVKNTWKGPISRLYMYINGTTPEIAAKTPLFYSLQPNISRFNGMFCTSPSESIEFYTTKEAQQEGEALWNLSIKFLTELNY